MYQDDELLHEFVVESSAHLAQIEGQLLQIEADVSAFIDELEAIANGQTQPELSSEEGNFVVEPPSMSPSSMESVLPETEEDLVADKTRFEQPLTFEGPITTPSKTSLPIKKVANRDTTTKSVKPVNSRGNGSSELKEAKAKATDSIVRVNVALLDRLMNLAGELVLSRNQLLLAVSNGVREGLESIASQPNEVSLPIQCVSSFRLHGSSCKN